MALFKKYTFPEILNIYENDGDLRVLGFNESRESMEQILDYLKNDCSQSDPKTLTWLGFLLNDKTYYDKALAINPEYFWAIWLKYIIYWVSSICNHSFEKLVYAIKVVEKINIY